ncbi:unnamed protein product [Ixodes pacificus]
MKFVIPGVNVKIFGKAVHALSKIGEELYLIADDESLSLKVFSMSMSCYACFRLLKSFFSVYETSGEGFKGKLSMRSILLAFRTVNGMEKTVEECLLEVSESCDDAVITLKHRKGMTKRFRLPLIEYETLLFSFQTEGYSNEISGQSKLLTDVLVNFPTSVQEVTLRLSLTKLDVCNHVDDTSDPLKTVNTSVSIESSEFDEFRAAGDGGEVTFCLREFRALLGFCEGLCLNATLHFDGAGEPLLASFEGVPGLESSFVTATLADGPQSLPASRSGSVATHRHAVPQRRPGRPDPPEPSESEPGPSKEPSIAAKKKKAMLLGLTTPDLDHFTSQLPQDDPVLVEASDDEEGD